MTIKHEFDGQEREFHIHRNNVSVFDAALGRSAYAVLKEFMAGAWRFDDLAKVLSFALYGPSKELKSIHDMAKRAGMHGFNPSGYAAFIPHPSVVKHLQDAGHGNYAELAVSILTETIFREAADGQA